MIVWRSSSLLQDANKFKNQMKGIIGIALVNFAEFGCYNSHINVTYTIPSR